MGGPFPMLQPKYIFQIKYTQAILSNSTRKLLWFSITKMLTAVLKNKLVLFVIIFGTRSFHIRIILIPNPKTARRPLENHYKPLTTEMFHFQYMHRNYSSANKIERDHSAAMRVRPTHIAHDYQLSLTDPRDKIVLNDLCDEQQWSSVGARRYYQLS